MSDKDKSLNSVMDSLIDGVSGLISSKTVVGEPVTVGDTIIVPLVEVSFGAGGGAAAGAKSGEGSAGGCTERCLLPRYWSSETA